MGAEIIYEKVEKISENSDEKIVYTEANEYKCKSIIIATGTKRRKLEVEKEDEFVGRGLSYCATCDGAFFKGKKVAVVGGGNTALEDAVFLSNYCEKVYIIHRREKFRAEEKLVKKLRGKENVEFVLNSSVKYLKGEEVINAIGVYNSETDLIKKIEISGIFVAIGQIPDNEAFLNVIDVDETGFIEALEDCKTKVEGIFAAGDCRTKKVRQLTTAAADGAVAALAACEYIG